VIANFDGRVAVAALAAHWILGGVVVLPALGDYDFNGL